MTLKRINEDDAWNWARSEIVTGRLTSCLKTMEDTVTKLPLFSDMSLYENKDLKINYGLSKLEELLAEMIKAIAATPRSTPPQTGTLHTHPSA